MGSPIDFAALARQFGGRSMLSSHEPTKPTPQPAQDYATLAQQFGGRSLIQTPPTGPQVALPKGTEWDDPLTMAVGFGKGLLGIDQAPGVTPSGFGAMLGAVVPVAKGLKALRAIATGEKTAQQTITAFHGSPHDFDRFDMSKIGTGEGAQAFGHGLYFAENPNVAKEYKEKLRTSAPFLRDGQATNYGEGYSQILESMADLKLHPDHKRAIASQVADLVADGKRLSQYSAPTGFEMAWDRAVQAAGKIKRNKGKTYEVKINAAPDEFLDWDKPLSEQPEAVRKFFGYTPRASEVDEQAVFDKAKRLGVHPTDLPEYKELTERMDKATELDAKYPTGGNIYESAKLVPGDYRDKVAATEKLKELGVKGIKYFDGLSRGTGEGSRNYVVFDDALVEILKKYGILLPAAGVAQQTMKSPSGGDR